MNDIKAKILLVDDRPENLFALEKIVQGKDRELYKASSGDEALKLNLEHDFALILSDVQMPGMDGFEMLEILRMDEKAQLIPVIFLTALSKEDKYIRRGYDEGAVDYLFKPLDSQIVRSKVDVFIALYKNRIKLDQQANQLRLMNEEKNKFLGMAAHDLRNPIGVIEHYSNFLLEDLEGKISDEAMSFLEIIKTSSNTMNHLVVELLDVARIESGSFKINPSPAKINDVIEHSITMNKIYAQRKNINLVTELDPNIPVTMLDANKIVQVFNNLISNAIKYSEESTRTIITSRFKKNYLVVSVEDNGIGIPQSALKSLFEAFTTTENKATNGEQSTGLGLMIAAKIVHAHSGEIAVESEQGRGSVFTVKLPLNEVDSSEKEADSTPDAIVKRPELNVLLVDDNEIIRAISKEVFRPFGVNLTVAKNGEDALQKISQAKEAMQSIDIVFTDLNMPAKDGFELSEEIRQSNSQSILPIIGLSATLDDEIIGNCQASGMNSCREKPIDASVINKVFDKYCKA